MKTYIDAAALRDWFEIVKFIASLLGITLPTLFGIYSIRKVAEESRLSSVHAEMRACLIKAVEILGREVDLLDGVANGVTYRRRTTGQDVETAYTRFWREIDGMVAHYKEISAGLRLLLPKDLSDRLRDLVSSVNEAKDLAADEFELSELRRAVDEAGKLYREFVNTSRAYIKADELKPLDSWKRGAIESEEEVERSENRRRPK